MKDLPFMFDLIAGWTWIFKGLFGAVQEYTELKNDENEKVFQLSIGSGWI
jgi:hypothetical protein